MRVRDLFVGRSHELEALERVIGDALGGSGQVVLLEGEAGAGKTTLAERVASHARSLGARIVRGRAWDGEGAPSLYPWRAILRSLDVTIPSVPKSAAPDEARFVVLDAAVESLREAARSTPLVILLDDLHDADPASIMLLKLLARQVRDAPICVLATFRSLEARASPERAGLLVDIARDALTIPVLGLDEAAIRDVLHAIIGAAPPELVARMQQATAGNALFVVETAALLATESRVRGDKLPLPATVREMLRRRLSALDERVRSTLAIAALQGREVRRARLIDVLGLEPARVDDALSAGESQELLVPSGAGSWTFAHDLLRDALEATLEPSARVGLHQRLAASLSERDDEDALVARAHHSFSADPASPDGVAASLRAARLAMARASYHDAVSAFRRALEGLDAAHEGPTSARAEALVSLGEATVWLGDVERGRALCREGAALARTLGASELVARSAMAMGAHQRMGRVDPELVSALEAALAALGPEGPAALRVPVTARLAAARQPAADPSEPLSLARAALAEARASGDDALLLRTLHGARGAFRMLDDLDERIAIDEQTSRLAEKLADPAVAARAHGRLVYDHLEAGDVASSRAHLEAQHRFASRIGSPLHHVQVELARSMHAMLRADLAEAERHTRAAETIGERWAGIGEVSHAAFAINRLALCSANDDREGLRALLRLAMPPGFADTFETLVLSRLGDADAVADRYARLSARGAATSLPLADRVALAEACVLLGDSRGAAAIERSLRPYADRAIAWPAFGACDGPVAGLLARLALVRGDEGLARQLFERALALARRMDDRLRLATLQRESRELARRGPPAPPPAAKGRPDPLRFEREGETWRLELGAERVRVTHSDGLAYLAHLVAQPDTHVHVTDLVTLVRKVPGVMADGAATPALDRKATQAYRRRLAELRADLEDATRQADLGRAARVRGEIELIETELGRAFGLGGRERRTSSNVERARVNVTMRIRKAIERIREHAPGIAHHLKTCVRTGTTCSYEPPPLLRE